MKTGKILIVDDNQIVRQNVKEILQEEGFPCVDDVGERAAVVRAIKTGDYDVICMDIMMPGLNGIEVIKQIRKFNETVSIAIITGHREENFADDMMKFGVYAVLDKPFKVDELVRIIQQGIELKRARKRSDEQG